MNNDIYLKELIRINDIIKAGESDFDTICEIKAILDGICISSPLVQKKIIQTVSEYLFESKGKILFVADNESDLLVLKQYFNDKNHYFCLKEEPFWEYNMVDGYFVFIEYEQWKRLAPKHFRNDVRAVTFF